MKKIAVGVISAMVGGAMLLSGGAASAQQKTSDVDIQSISPNPVVVPKGGERDAFIRVDATSDVDKVVVKVQPEGESFRTLSEKTVTRESWRFAVSFNSNDPEGKWSAIAEGFNKDGKKVAEDKAFFSVDIEEGKADTRITRFNADPYKVRKGKYVHFNGRLQVNDGGWEGARGEKVHIYYRANGYSTWKWVASDRTSWGGKFYAKARAWKSGTYKAVFKGDDDLKGSESRRDYVRVVRW
ncbi:hypothetical protein ACIBKY_06130 [Nonomuraea sp. NPDC050394]|uniref:hypothetical protein n=1 Tax=Nonomuraea sp. NPDC050394 TaxID=3364363 RepID=UPI00379A5AFF